MRIDVADLRRVGLTDHAVEKWEERIGLPTWKAWSSLARSRAAGRQLRRRVREGMCPDGRWPRPTRVRVDRGLGVVFLLVPASPGRWAVSTVLPLDACRVGPEVAELGQEGELCPVGSQ